jgi:hypothetical protein
MYEKELFSFCDITLLFLYQGLYKWSKVNVAIGNLNYFDLLERFAKEKVEVINDEENFNILLNKSSYVFCEFYTLS